MIKSLIALPPKITVVWSENNENEIIVGTISKEDLDHLIAFRDEYTKEQLIELICPEIKDLLSKNKYAKEIVKDVIKDDRFYVQNGSLYRKGIALSIPIDLAAKIQTIINSGDVVELDKFDRFWMWTSLIKHPKSRESFYKFCKKNNLIITNEGFVIGFRRANYVGGDPKIDELYKKRRASKKSTQVDVYELDGDYSLVEKDGYNNIGILKELFHEENPYFYSSYNNSFTFRMGEEAFEKDVDWNPFNECSRGLHLHLGKYNDSSFGNHSIYVVVNPKDVVACPYEDGSKMRVQAFTPIGFMNGEYSDFKMTSEIQEYVSNLFENSLNDLETMIANNNYEEFKTHELLKEVVISNHLFNISNNFKQIKPIINVGNQ